MYRLWLAVFMLAICCPAVAGAQGNLQENEFYEQIVSQCVAEVQASHGVVKGDTLQACLKEKGMKDVSAPPPKATRMGAYRAGIKPPAISDYGNGDKSYGKAVPPQDYAAPVVPAPVDSFAGGVAGDDGDPQTSGGQASKTPSASKRYYLQSKESGTGPKPIFLNR